MSLNLNKFLLLLFAAQVNSWKKRVANLTRELEDCKADLKHWHLHLWIEHLRWLDNWKEVIGNIKKLSKKVRIFIAWSSKNPSRREVKLLGICLLLCFMNFFCRNFVFVDCFSNPEKWEKFARWVIADSVSFGSC